jgi:hypothetical protein
MRAHSVGTTSATGRSHSTMPPEWMPRCRGRPCSRCGEVEHVGGDSGRLQILLAGVRAELLGPRVLAALRVAERTGRVAHRAPGR